MASWTEEEFSQASFNDERLRKRFELLVDQLGQKAGRSIPFACEDWAATKAAYRFFDNPKVDQKEMVRTHQESTQRRTEQSLAIEEGPVLVIQDTTFLNYSHIRKQRGLESYPSSRIKTRRRRGKTLNAVG